MENKALKILSIGNSFSDDTMNLTPYILKSAGIDNFKIANLYIGGCSVNRHYGNALNDTAEYDYYVHTGDGWTITKYYPISKAVTETEWDFINIQHGTGDKSRYTSPESYDNLLPLVNHIKNIANNGAKIVFNMAWVAEPDSTHHEISSYGGNQLLMYNKLTRLTKTLIATKKEIDIVSPTGTAIQNARTCINKKLTRDNFHLSYDLGRYVAGLTFLGALCGLDLSKITYRPESVSTEEQTIAIKAATAALENPYSITQL